MEIAFKTDPTFAPTIHKTRMVLIDVTIVVISTYIKYGIIRGSRKVRRVGVGVGVGGKGEGSSKCYFLHQRQFIQ